MLDIGWPELMVVAVVTLLVVGPKELPRVLRTVTLWVRKAREVARDFQSGLDEMVREADLDDVKKHMTEAASANLGTDLNELMDPDHSIGGEFSGDPFADADKSPTGSGTETATKVIEGTEAEAETPAASKAETPAASKAETPAASKAEVPAASKAETPAASKSEVPAATEAEAPAVVDETAPEAAPEAAPEVAPEVAPEEAKA